YAAAFSRSCTLIAICRILGLSMSNPLLCTIKSVQPTRSTLFCKFIAHLVMNVDAVEKEPAHARALPGVTDRELLKLRRSGVSVEDIETFAAMLDIGNGVEPEMFDVFLVKAVNFAQGGKKLAVEHRRLGFGADVRGCDTRDKRFFLARPVEPSHPCFGGG